MRKRLEFSCPGFDVDAVLIAPGAVEQGVGITLAAITQQRNDAAAFAACAHALRDLQAGNQVGARGAAVTSAEEGFQGKDCRTGRCILDLDHVIDHVKHEAWLDMGPADALDQGWLRGHGIRIAFAPAVYKGTAGRLGDTESGRRLAITQVAADGRRSAAGAGAADDPFRYRMWLMLHLAQDRFGDVVVAAPVGSAFCQDKLVEMAGADGDMPVRAGLGIFGVGDQIALAAKCLERGLLILTCGVYGDVVRMLTPLTASEAILNEGLDVLESAILGN